MLLMAFSLVPFGLSTATALVAWELLEAVVPSLRLTISIVIWITVFALGTRALWRVAGALASQ